MAESEYEKYRQKMINVEDTKEIKELEAGLKKLENKKKYDNNSQRIKPYTLPSSSKKSTARAKTYQ